MKGAAALLRAETTSGYAEQAAARAAGLVDPIERALLAAVASGASVKGTAKALGIPRTTARDIVRRLMARRTSVTTLRARRGGDDGPAIGRNRTMLVLG